MIDYFASCEGVVAFCKKRLFFFAMVFFIPLIGGCGDPKSDENEGGEFDSVYLLSDEIKARLSISEDNEKETTVPEWLKDTLDRVFLLVMKILLRQKKLLYLV
ncbi:hypothetical protein [Endozoicomonas sp. Mp262]|uniref:hypothetical protein n=1 Tax=Endozoicomonas sp. Mp262 TaxID=2919499 RepID=UPI0021D9C6F7